MELDPAYARNDPGRVADALDYLGNSVPESFRIFFEQHSGPFSSQHTGFMLLDLYEDEPSILSQTLACREHHGWDPRFLVITDLLANAVLVLDAVEDKLFNVDFERGDEELAAGSLAPSWGSFTQFLEFYFDSTTPS